MVFHIEFILVAEVAVVSSVISDGNVLDQITRLSPQTTLEMVVLYSSPERRVLPEPWVLVIAQVAGQLNGIVGV